MLEVFQNFTLTRLSLDELVELSAYGRALKAEYEANKIDTPEFVDVQLGVLSREIASRVADKREARKRQIKAQLAGLKTAAEKRAELEAELAAIG